MDQLNELIRPAFVILERMTVMRFRRLITITFSTLCAVMACGLALGAPGVSNVTAPSSSVNRYGVFTISFAVSTVATQLLAL